ncbi:putative RNA polymerase, sigma-24 subunit, ECF subfamily [metagenome]|uniref:Putative RNA polymerase, sigma-24 subunit, ECF subfamily n=1 Tax=metagenome TaxID=256318 RepID=A0A2P2C4B6_9ZZZZ
MTTLEQIHRDEWGRLLALLVARFRRLDVAEDGLADAFEAAARTWPTSGTPTNPAAWLLTAARRRILDRLRSEAVVARKEPLLVVDARTREEAQRSMADPGNTITDERLRLVLLCAHPALSPESAVALTLRLVLGVPTEEIASLFLVPRATMAARLTRARRRLAGQRFEVPAADELDARVDTLATVAYLAFTSGYLPGRSPELAGEGVRLTRLVHDLLPDNAVLTALLALVLLQHSRRDARTLDGLPVLLPDQDRQAWHRLEIDEALELLRPLIHHPPEPYLLQALIAAEHAVAARAEDTDWPRIVSRYDELVACADSPVVRLNRAVAVAEADGPLAGLAALREVALPGHRLPGVRAELLARAGRLEEAREAYDEAIALCDNEPERLLLSRRRQQG